MKRLRPPAVVAVVAVVACGARTELPAPESTGGAGAVGATNSVTTGGQRSCPPECVIGHECCKSGCNSPPVSMPSDCCTCLPGETNSMTCPDDRCLRTD